ncbi:MAG: hypothetical protein ACRDRV_04110 [Pseudonocardiaceae bacterium]
MDHAAGTQRKAVRRAAPEHLVAAAMVAAVTVVLGFASGLGVRDADAAAAPQPGTAGPPVAQPQQTAPPAAGVVPAGAARPGGSQVGVRPGSRGTAGLSGSSVRRPATGNAATPDSAAQPGNPTPSAPQCPAGALDQILALVTQVTGGATPARALSDAGAVPGTSAPAVPGLAGLAIGAGEAPTLLPAGDRTVPVFGLVPLLDAVAQREQARSATDIPLPLLAAPPAPDAGQAGPAAPAAPGAQITELTTLLAPLGLGLDLVSGLSEPLLAPVLGSVGCTGVVPAVPTGPANPTGGVR